MRMAAGMQERDVKRLNIGPRMSQAVVHGDVVYLAGLVADDTGAGVRGQTKQILATIDALLAQAGTSKERLLTGMIWLSDISSFDEMNEVWDAWVASGQTPTRACVEARLARPDLKVEIQVTAASGARPV
jgi:enamine deaminase RidA (YjgF/YER057c/UK114 family)